MSRYARARLALWHARNDRMNGYYRWRPRHAWLLELAADLRAGRI